MLNNKVIISSVKEERQRKQFPAVVLNSNFLPLIKAKRKTKLIIPKIMNPSLCIGDICYICEEFQNYYSANLNEKLTLYKLDFINDNKYCNLIQWEPASSLLATDARFFIKINNVEEKKIKDLTENKLIAYGIDKFCDFADVLSFDFKKKKFEKIWDSTYNIEEIKYDKNPEVYIYTFDVISTTGIKETSTIASDSDKNLQDIVHFMYLKEKQNRCCANCIHSEEFATRYYSCDLYHNYSVYKKCCKSWKWKYYDILNNIMSFDDKEESRK